MKNIGKSTKQYSTLMDMKIDYKGKERKTRKREIKRRKTGPSPQYKSYTPLTDTEECILKECFNVKFKYGNIEFMLPIREMPWADKKKIL